MGVLGKKIEDEIEHLAKQYPSREAILLPVLHAVMEEHGFISEDAKKAVAEKVGVSLARVYEVVTFYTMFSETPQGKHRLTVCVNLTCGLMGGESLCKYLSDRLEIAPGETTQDGRFTLLRTNECLAACDQAPMMQINERYYGKLNRDKVDAIFKELKSK